VRETGSGSAAGFPAERGDEGAGRLIADVPGQVATSDPSGAAATLTEAIRLNPDLRSNARRDPDLAALRAGGQLATLLR
jgi:hypothetical protein